MEEAIQHAALEVASLIDAAATLVIAAASLEVLVRSAIALLHVRLGRELAADSMAPRQLDRSLAGTAHRQRRRTNGGVTFVDQVGQLGAIVVLRVVINYTLMYDMKEGVPPPPPAP